MKIYPVSGPLVRSCTLFSLFLLSTSSGKASPRRGRNGEIGVCRSFFFSVVCRCIRIGRLLRVSDLGDPVSGCVIGNGGCRLGGTTYPFTSDPSVFGSRTLWSETVVPFTVLRVRGSSVVDSSVPERKEKDGSIRTFIVC